jgi:hypothetical protein
VGNLVYGHQGISDTAIKKRFYDLMTFAKTVDHEVLPLYDETVDDQSGPGLLQQGLEDLYELYSDYAASIGEEIAIASTGSLAKKVLDNKAKAKAMYNASMGMLTDEDKALLGIVRKKKRAKRNPPPSEISALIQLTKDQAKRWNEYQRMKESRRREKQAWKDAMAKREVEFQAKQLARAEKHAIAQSELHDQTMLLLRQIREINKQQNQSK